MMRTDTTHVGEEQPVDPCLQSPNGAPHAGTAALLLSHTNTTVHLAAGAQPPQLLRWEGRTTKTRCGRTIDCTQIDQAQAQQWKQCVRCHT